MSEQEIQDATPVGGGVVNQPVQYPGDVTPPLDPLRHSYTPEEVKEMAGELKPGQVGYITLDENGEPEGPATAEPPEDPGDKPIVRVVGAPQARWDEVVTPSGAPITKCMNPDPTLWDAGMLQRNPPDGVPQPAENPDYKENGPYSDSTSPNPNVRPPPGEQEGHPNPTEAPPS